MMHPIHNVIRPAFFAFGILLCANASRADAQDLNGALLILRRSAQTAANRAEADQAISETVKAKSQAVIKQIDELDDILGSSGKASSPEYILTLQSDALALAGSARADPNELNLSVMAISQDLDVKLAAARSGLGLSAGAGINVRVQVTTVVGSNSVDGYLVFANPIRYQGSDPLFPFGNPSSPTERGLAPGRYELTAHKPGSAESKQVFDIGASGEPQVVLRMLVQ